MESDVYNPTKGKRAFQESNATRFLSGPAGFEGGMHLIMHRTGDLKMTRLMALMFFVPSVFAGPLPDMIVYGNIPGDGGGKLPMGPDAKVLAEVITDSGRFEVAGTRFSASTEGGEHPRYVIRIPRMAPSESGRPSGLASPGDQIEILVDHDGDGSVSALERSNLVVPRLAASATERNIVRLDLDQSFDDKDSDGLADAWEKFHFGHSNWDGWAAPFGSGISNLIALAMGLDPLQPDRSGMPRLVREADGVWFCEFQLAAAFNGTTARLMEADSPAGPWMVAQGAIFDLPAAADRTLFRQRVPVNAGVPRRFYRLEVTASNRNQP